MPRLNQLANRLTLTQEEVHILRGIARAMLKSAPTPAADAGVDVTPAASAPRD
jgi:tRNA/rRNA methyltransferase